VDISVHTVIISVWTVFYMKKSFRMVLLSAAVVSIVWISSYGRWSQTVLSPQELREIWADMMDAELAKGYIREKFPLIRRIMEITYRSFGLNG